MSTTLKMRPLTEGRVMPYELKQVLRRRFVYPCVVTHEDRAYFEALADAQIKGAADVIKAIDKYDAVQLTEDS